MPHPGTASQDGALRAHLAGHPRLCPWFLAPGPPGTRALGQAWAGMCVGSLPGSQGSPVGRVDRECWSRRTRRPRARPSPLSARHAPGHPSLPVDRKACLRQSGSCGWHSAGADPTSPELGGRGSWRPLGPGLAAPRSTRAGPRSRSADGQRCVGCPVAVLQAALSAGRGCHPPSSRPPAGRGRAGTALRERVRGASAGGRPAPSAAHGPPPRPVSL